MSHVTDTQLRQAAAVFKANRERAAREAGAPEPPTPAELRDRAAMAHRTMRIRRMKQRGYL